MDVLVVEDEPLVRETAVAVLREDGFSVVGAASAEEALALAESAANGDGMPPAVVVVDLRLGPGMDGLALGAEARRRWPGVGIVYATGHPDSFDGRLLGPRERYVLKPFAPAALLGAVRRLYPTRLLGLPLQ
jgi:DNA-binding response OmpR family regulator